MSFFYQTGKYQKSLIINHQQTAKKRLSGEPSGYSKSVATELGLHFYSVKEGFLLLKRLSIKHCLYTTSTQRIKRRKRGPRIAQFDQTRIRIRLLIIAFCFFFFFATTETCKCFKKHINVLTNEGMFTHPWAEIFFHFTVHFRYAYQPVRYLLMSAHTGVNAA